MKNIKAIAVLLTLILSLTATIFAVNKFAFKTVNTANCCADAACCSGGDCKMGDACCGVEHKNRVTAAKKSQTVKAIGVPVEDASLTVTTSASCHQAAGKNESCCTKGAACCNGGSCCDSKKKQIATTARL